MDTPKQRVISDRARDVISSTGDINVRKRMLHELFGALRIVQMTSNLLRKDETLRLPVEALTDRVGEWLPNENPQADRRGPGLLGPFRGILRLQRRRERVYLDVGQETT